MTAEAVRAWLEARYDEDETAAKAAHGGGWEIVLDVIGEGETGPARIGSPTFRDPDGGDWKAPDIAQQLADADAEHIFRWQPRRALVEVAAKRRRLERHAPSMRGAAGRPWCTACSTPWEWRNDPDRERTVDWPCPDVIDDAQSYADRADFPQELKLP